MTWAGDRMDRTTLKGLERVVEKRQEEIALGLPPPADLGDPSSKGFHLRLLERMRKALPETAS
jgi:hypothetical protein